MADLTSAPCALEAPDLGWSDPNRESRIVRCVASFRPLSPPCHVCAGNAFEGTEETCCHAAHTLCLPMRAKAMRDIRLVLCIMPHANSGRAFIHSILHGYTLLLASRRAQVMIITSSFSAFELRATSLVRSFSLRPNSYSRETSLVRAKPRRRPCAIVSCVACLVVLLCTHHCCSPGCTRDRSRWSRACPCAQYTSSRCQRSACRAARPAVSASGSRERASGGSGRRPLEGACSIWSSGGICGHLYARQPPCRRRAGGDCCMS